MASTEMDGQSFDFIICGGGTAGLALASRLSENPEFTVLVVEAGSDKRGDPLVNTPGTFLQLYDNPEYDWSFHTTPQKATNNTQFGWPRGKGLGGSSMINFLMWGHCSRGDIDIWRDLGNEGWGWDDFMPYLQKVEHVHIPTDETATLLQSEYVQPDLRGKRGPVQISFPRDSFTFLHEIWPQLGKNLGHPNSTDPRTGTSLGLFNQLTTVDPDLGQRSYSANTYLSAAEGRPNVTVVTNALVSRVLLDAKGSGAERRATGVELNIAGSVSTVNANKEIIVCAGAIQSPQILELSGIGRRDVLDKQSINVEVENPNVGEHLQDHPLCVLSLEAQEGVPTLETFRDNPAIVAQLMDVYSKTKSGPLAGATTTTGYLSLQNIDSSMSVSTLLDDGPRIPEKQSSLLLSQLEDPAEAEFQVSIMATGTDTSNRYKNGPIFSHSTPGNYVTIGFGLTHPFSRGSVHISSKDINTHPDIDPAYFGHSADLTMLAYGMLHAKKMFNTAPLKDYVKADTYMPGSRPFDTLEEAKEVVKERTITEYHPIATCSMLPEAEGGVVDNQLRVYGVKNLRVVDASIFPTHVQGNIVSLVYAVAEKAADMIKATHG